MSCESLVERRAFVAGCVGAAGLLLLPMADAVVGPRRLSATSVIIDPTIEAAAAFGALLGRRGAQCHVLTGDPYRFIRGVLNAGETPAAVAGMGTYALFLIATGVLREARYTLVSHGLHQSVRARHCCYGEWSGCESALQRSATDWLATLVEVMAGPTTDATTAQGFADLEAADTGAVLSWVMRSPPARRFT